MSSDEDRHYEFVCPACGEALEVNASMRSALVERGCVICGADVSGAAFSDIANAS